MVLKRKLPTKNDAEANANKDAPASTPAEKSEVKEEVEQRPSRYADKAKEDAAEAAASAEPVTPEAPTPQPEPKVEATAPEEAKEKPKAAPLKRSMPKKSESADKPKKQEKKTEASAPKKSEAKKAEPKPKAEKKPEPKAEKPATQMDAPAMPVKAPPPTDFKVPEIAPLGVPPETESVPTPMASPNDMSASTDTKESIMPWMEQKASPMEAPQIDEKQPVPDNVETPATPMGGAGSWLTDETSPPSLGNGDSPEKPESAASPFSVEPISPPPSVAPPLFGEAEEAAKPEDSMTEEKPFSFGGAGQPPWKRNENGGAAKGEDNPPVLPDAFQVAKDVGKKGFIGKVVTGVIALVVIVFAVKMYNQRDKATEMLARWTGTLKQVSEEVPETAEDKTALVQPEDIVQPGQDDSFTQNTEVESEIFDELPDLEEFSVGDTQIEVLDVPLDEAGQPIVAGKDDEMPEDLSLFANIQRAISDAQTEKSVEEAKEKGFEVGEGKSEPTEEEIYLRNREMTLELQQQLSEYRKALAGESDPLKKPKPSEFFGTQEKAQTEAAMLEPPQETARFGANPYDLPVVPEPSAEEEVPTVRTLSDFEATMYEKQETRIRMPRGIRPKMENSDMVALEILSFVPNRGIIAFHQGREGVLLIGEAIEGWELVAVYEHYAEFSNGTRRQTVTMR